jgi:hypothetical protein
VSAELSEKRNSTLSWLEWVLKLDSWLRRRQGIYEFSTDRRCLFRAGIGPADRALSLSDGTQLEAGDPILSLHLWNEHIPPMGLRGPTVAWARQMSRAAHLSLHELERHLQQHAELDDVVAICGDMHLGSVRQAEQFTRIVSRYGFEPVDEGEAETSGALHRFGKNILVLLLVAATNPVALRRTLLRRLHRRVFMSRAVLARRYR